MSGSLCTKASKMNTALREYPGHTAAGGACLPGVSPFRTRSDGSLVNRQAYKYRLAFDVWINDVRDEAMPLRNWPYGVLDDKTVDGIIRALDVQSEYGYTVVDLAGLWTTYSWPVNISKVVDKDRQRRINRIIRAVHERKMKLICFPSGILNWGFDEIIRRNPELRSGNKHEMNPLREESWQWLYKVFDYAADNYDIDGYHLEAADQGRCETAESLEKWPDNVAYYCYVTGRMADYIRRKHPNMMVITTIQGFGPWGVPFTEQEKEDLIKLSRSVDCIFDQGHYGTYIPPREWKEFIPRLHCSYGTSGGIWIYPNERWERTRWFLPYTQHTGREIKELYEAGGSGVMYYQGPVINPSVELNMAFGGEIMSDVGKSTEGALADVLKRQYRPKTTGAHCKLVEIYERAESVYFGQWDRQRISEVLKRPAPGNFHLTNSFGATPGAPTYLMEPYLNTMGRSNYKEGLISILRDIGQIESNLDDNGRTARIKEGIEETLVDINNIARCKGERKVWDDENVGRQF